MEVLLVEWFRVYFIQKIFDGSIILVEWKFIDKDITALTQNRKAIVGQAMDSIFQT